jgi:predicted amino acid-binding ACT domain protein
LQFSSFYIYLPRLAVLLLQGRIVQTLAVLNVLIQMGIATVRIRQFVISMAFTFHVIVLLLETRSTAIQVAVTENRMRAVKVHNRYGFRTRRHCYRRQ